MQWTRRGPPAQPDRNTEPRPRLAPIGEGRELGDVRVLLDGGHQPHRAFRVVLGSVEERVELPDGHLLVPVAVQIAGVHGRAAERVALTAPPRDEIERSDVQYVDVRAPSAAALHARVERCGNEQLVPRRRDGVTGEVVPDTLPAGRCEVVDAPIGGTGIVRTERRVGASTRREQRDHQSVPWTLAQSS